MPGISVREEAVDASLADLVASPSANPSLDPNGPKRPVEMPGAAHATLGLAAPEQWRAAVAEFLDRSVSAGP